MSDTTLVFRFVPEGAGAVQRDIAKTAAAAEAASAVNERSSKKSAAASRSASQQITGDQERVAQGAEKESTKASRSTSQLEKAWGKLGKQFGGLGVLFNPMMLIGVAIAGAIGPVVAFTYAASQMFGILAAGPAAVVGAAAGIGSLLLIFHGISSAMQMTGQSAAQFANQIVVAEHSVAQAQQAGTVAQKELNQSRIDATRNLRDMALALQEANLGQKEATLAVKRAQIALRNSATVGTLEARQEAELNLQSAQLALQRANNKASDTQYDLNVAQTKGVEGSDQVVAALNQQAEAIYQLQQAEFQLSQAKIGSGAMLAYARLSQAGKDLVNTLRGQVIPAWRGFQQQMQQIGLAGVASAVVGVSGALMVQQGHLYDIAGAWNAVFLAVAGFLQAPSTVAGLNVALANTATMSHNLVGAWQPFLHGFLEFVTVGSDFLPRLGTWVTNLAVQFDNWATAAANSGKMHAWIQNAVTAAHDLWRWIDGIAGGIGQIFKAGSGGPDYLSKLADSAQRWRDLMASPEMQQGLAKFFAASRTLGSSAWVVITALTSAITNMPGVLKEAAGALNIVGDALKFAADNAGLVQTILPPLITLFVAYKVATMAAAIWTQALALWEARKKIALVASKVATVAITIATAAWNVVQAILDAELWANPIGVIILLILALVAVVVLVIKYHKELGEFFGMVWGHIWDFLKMIGAWFAGPFAQFFIDGWHTVVGLFEGGVAWVMGWVDRFLAPILAIKDHIEKVGIWQTLVDGFKAAVNALIYLWDKLDFGIHIKAPDWMGGFHFDVDRIFPYVPSLDSGGRITQEGLAYVHAGEQVVSAAQVDRNSSGAGATQVTLLVQSGGSKLDDLIHEMIRRYVRVQGGGNVQIAYGKTGR